MNPTLLSNGFCFGEGPRAGSKDCSPAPACPDQKRGSVTQRQEGGSCPTFITNDLVRSTWSHAIQHGAPPSALLVRGLERCAQRDDTRLSRVVIDLLGA